MYVAPVSAITFMTYEILKRFAKVELSAEELDEL